MVITLEREPAGPRPAGSRASAAPVASPPSSSGSVLLWRARLAAACLGFVGLALSQSPGRVLADTKLDMAVDPLAFLGRALQLWDAEGFAGQVQNQAYGYLFPMGPFFALGDVVGLPAWIVQRLWLALLLCTAFLGVVALARRLGIGTPATALLAGVAYALAPRVITALGATSVEIVPMAVAPWVLVPLVGAAAGQFPRRAAALSGLAVFCAGGVNAVAAATVLPLPVLWLLTRPAGRARRRLAAWWAAAVVLATAWWVGPLLLLGRYSPPFLDYIETAGTTTAPTDVLSVLRGTAHWVASLGSPTGPHWPAGWALVHDVLPVAGTVLLAVAGLVALTRAELPERTWLVLGVLAGTALVTLGHVATVDGLLADPLHAALDGPLAPLRNVHKFDPVLRLPLVLGLAHLAALLFRRGRQDVPRAPAAWRRRVARDGARSGLVLLALALICTASPAVAGRLAPPTGFEQIPAYWQQTADYLAEAQPSGRALLVPGSSFATYAWGSPNDEPLQPLARSPWEVRSAIPLTPEAHIRMLDGVEQSLARGEGSAGLSRFLARAGISHLVLRNDLDSSVARSTRPLLVRQALENSPGIERVAGFGPPFPGNLLLPGLVYDAGLGEPGSAVEIYEVADPAPRAWTAPLSDAVEVAGGPEAVLALEERGLLTDRPTVAAGAAPAGVSTTMVSDALLRRERTFGRITDAASAGLAPEDPLRLEGPARDYAVALPERTESDVRYGGGVPSASSSESDPDGLRGTRPDAQPWAALDGDPTTAWRPADRLGEPQAVWWRLETDRPFLLAGTITVVLPAGGASDPPDRVRITTDAGSFSVALADTDQPQLLPVPTGRTDTLTIRSAPLPGGGDDPGLALAEVRVPGVSVTRTVVTPEPAGPVDVYAFDAAGPAASGCVTDADGEPRCAAALVTGAEEAGGLDRAFAVERRADYAMTVTAVPRPGPALDALLATASGSRIGVTASSTAVPDPSGSVAAAVDGDPATAWLAAPSDRQPTLELTWPEPRTVDSLRVFTRPGLAAAVPTTVTIDAGNFPRTLNLDGSGRATFAPVTTDRLRLTFGLPLELTSFDPYTRALTPLGVGVSELELGDAPPARSLDPDAVVSVPCGEGPVVTVDGTPRQTSVRTTAGALHDLEPVELTLCAGAATADLAAGEHRLVAAGTDTLAVDSATLTRVGSDVSGTGSRTAVRITRWDAENRSVHVAARREATLLVVPENTNPGWTATLDGQRLETVAVDGWQQGYVLPAGAAGTVELDFGPGLLYRWALGIGAGAVLLLIALAVLRGRPARPSSPSGRRWSADALVVVAAIAGTALVGGIVGLGALLVAALGGTLAGRRRAAWLGAVAATALGGAGVLLLVDPGGTGTARQVLAVIALGAVVASALRLPGGGRSGAAVPLRS
ncbi:alpha-(1-_3)-arabinofuranosyltransferase family protein [Blastococcus sp. CT_GayMR16]|uniref:alpha-(1->3)-arabinofuranosyltransferase domain-containing protein n=1 Tax=Blastococcus sp. CT_GayMR16 TaxID=2559607 RepID=UPI0010743671|nr:alpha-(1->3)-arabinofuranosyltransferase family protein [Blastococcus sp. CT_GayMR16]TFV82847.1 DUF3367 domain-containing protein [Blastococcus sp. CT_GayMR16]